MQNLIEAIHNKLKELEKAFQEKQQKSENNREEAIALIGFITDTINAIAPRKIDARWYGSYKTPGVAGYPSVTVTAYHIQTQQLLGQWTINAGGDYPAPEISKEHIVQTINDALQQMKV